MQEIGGFIEIELPRGKEYHINAFAVNNGRNAFYLLLLVNRYKKVYLPYYCCDSLLEPIQRMGIEFEYYLLNERFEPQIPEITEDSVLLYINYFGLFEHVSMQLSAKYPNLIIDNTQAFFASPIQGVDTFYSPRKFFGVADGGYLYTDKELPTNLPIDHSFSRYTHLMKRFEIDAQSSYQLYLENEIKLSNLPLMHMSKMTSTLLESIDYQRALEVRERNFLYLHKHLGNLNQIKFATDTLNGPLVYPLLLENSNLKSYLISQKIYIPTYWNEVVSRVETGSFEHKLATQLIPLPIDQRYDLTAMQLIIDNVRRAN